MASDSNCWEQRQALEEQRTPSRRRSGSRPSRVPRSAQVYKSMGPDGMHPWLQREQVDEVVKPPTTTFERPWQISEGPID